MRCCYSAISQILCALVAEPDDQAHVLISIALGKRPEGPHGSPVSVDANGIAPHQTL